jgi:hypothetical protein
MFRRQRKNRDKVYDGQLARHVDTDETVYRVAVTVARECAKFVHGEFSDDARALYSACERVAGHCATSQEYGLVVRAFNAIRQLENER